MIAVDTNLLVYSHREDNEFHQQAKEVVDSLRGSPASWAIPWPCVHEFLAVVTHPNIYDPPTPMETALSAVEAWALEGNLQLLSEGEHYFDKLKSVIMAARLRGPRVHDARIAALCLHHGVRELWTVDRDFSLFPQLTTRNPLVRGSN
jgi:toxin-antitoxin system PIN domain toxin